MPQQPQTPNTTGNSQLDPQVVNLAKAIRETETRGQADPYTAKGSSGEFGAYQYTKGTWDKDAQQFLGRAVPLEQADKLTQNEVAYKKLESLKKQGYNPGQIASIWNSGKPEWEGNIGVNKHGVKYNVPQYVDSVTKAYQSLKQGEQPMYQDTASTVGKEQYATPDDQKKESTLGKIVDFMFPILEKKERTPLQTVGDTALSALWFIPGLGGAASGLLRGAGMAAKTAKTAGSVAEGVAFGYGADVSQKLSEGKDIGEAIKPGGGTLLGAGTGGLVSRFQNKYSQKGIIDNFAKENNSVFAQTKRGANELAESFSKNKNPGQLAAEKGINLKQLVDKDTIAYDTKAKATEVLNDARVLNETLTDALARTKGSRLVVELEAELLGKIPKNHPERADIVRKEMQLLKQQYGDTPTLADLNEWKQRNWNLGKFDMAISNDVRLTHKMIGNTLKTTVEKVAKENGLKEVGEMNEYIGSHLDLADMLEMLNGTKAKGGRLGNIMRDQALTTVGGVSGMFGAGPVGLLMGVLAGHYGSQAISTLMRKFEGSPIKSAILNRMIKEDPEIVQKVMQYANKTPGGLEKLKAQLKKEGIDIFPEKEVKAIAPKLVPQESAPSFVPGLINRAAGRFGAQ